MHVLEQSKYLFASITEAFKRVVNMKQKDNDNLLDYSKRLKQTKDVLEAQASKDILGHYVDYPEEFKNATDSEEKKKIKYEEFNKCMSYLLITNSYQSKYAILENRLASQYSMKNIQYPKDFISTVDIMKIIGTMIL